MDDEAALLALRAPVRRYVAPRADEHDVDDVVQEVLVRVWEVRDRLPRPFPEAYAVATARNVLQTRARAQQVHARHASRLAEPSTTGPPDERVLAQEEHRAVATALADLDEEDRALLVRAYAHGGGGVRSQAMTARLARSRSRARVGYLLAMRRDDLPTPQCRPVLEAVSSGDARERERAGVDAHLAACEVCAESAPALRSRRRALLGVLPVPLVLERVVREHPAGSAVTATAAAGAVVAGVLLLPADPPAPPPPVAAAAAPLSLTATGELVRPASGPVPGRDAVGQPVTGTALPVESVPADEGFWLGAGPGQRVWVHLVGGGESRAQVRAGDRVDLAGTVRPVQQASPELGGLEAGEGLAEAVADGAVVVVPTAALVLSPAAPPG